MQTPPAAAPLLLFDSACGFCDRAVTFVLAYERGPTLRFAPLDSPCAVRLLADHPALAELDTLLLFEDGCVHARSEAALRVARHLGWPWRALGLLRLVPRGLRDALYDAIAARRHRWFGRREACVRPARLVAARFVND